MIIHRLLKIDLEILIPTFLQSETRDKVRKSIPKLNKPKLDLKKTGFAQQLQTGAPRTALQKIIINDD